MPSTSRPSPCSGWLRRTCSNRRTSTASAASRNSSRGLVAAVVEVLDHGAEVGGERAAAHVHDHGDARDLPAGAGPRSTIVAISSGGRLSTTNQPRSSSTLAAVLRPAPDSPLTSATSMPVGLSAGDAVEAARSVRTSGAGARRPATPVAEPGGVAAGPLSAARTAAAVRGPKPGSAAISSTLGRPQLAHRAEVPEQRLRAGTGRDRARRPARSRSYPSNDADGGR